MPIPVRWYRPSQAWLTLLALGVLWWALTGDLGASWWLGLPLVLLATALAVFRTSAAWRFSPAGIIPFGWFLLRSTVAGAMDIARRAFDPRLPLAPAFLSCQLRMPDEAARVLATVVLNLQPGTLAAELDGRRVTLHVVDQSQSIEAEVRATEDAVAGLLGIALVPEEPNHEPRRNHESRRN